MLERLLRKVVFCCNIFFVCFSLNIYADIDVISFSDVEKARWFLQKYRELCCEIVDCHDNVNNGFASYDDDKILKKTILGAIDSINLCYKKEFDFLIQKSSFLDFDSPEVNSFVEDLRLFHKSLVFLCYEKMALNVFFASRKLDSTGQEIFKKFYGSCKIQDGDLAEHFLFKINILLLSLAYFLCEVRYGRSIGWWERIVNSVPFSINENSASIVSEIISGVLGVLGLYLQLAAVKDSWRLFHDFISQSNQNVVAGDSQIYRNSLDRQELMKNGLDIFEKGLVGGAMLLLLVLYKEKARLKKKDKKLNRVRIAMRESLIPHMIKHKSSFDRIQGEQYQCIKNILLEDVEAFKNHLKFEKYNSQPPRGILFHGDPGVGKTLFAKLFAHEIGYEFAAFDASDLLDDAKEFARKCHDAQAHAPIIILIDELQNICGEGAAFKSARSLLCTIIDGSHTRNSYEAPVIYVAAMSENPSTLGAGLKRRFERRINIEAPNENSRRSIIEYELKNELRATQQGTEGLKKIGSDVDLSVIARQTEGLSCDVLVRCIQEARRHVIAQNREFITMEDFNRALEIISDKKRGPA
jgi:AAA+ superfamily predicted ATPase